MSDSGNSSVHSEELTKPISWCDGVKIINVYMLNPTFSSIKERLAFVFSDFYHSTSSFCVWQIDFWPYIMKNQEEKEQEYMRGRWEVFRLNSKSIYIIKCLEQG